MANIRKHLLRTIFITEKCLSYHMSLTLSLTKGYFKSVCAYDFIISEYS